MTVLRAAILAGLVASTLPAVPALGGNVAVVKGVGAYACVWAPSRHDCVDNIVRIEGVGAAAVATLHLKSGAMWSSVHLLVDDCDPSGLSLDIGDSPSNNGKGGDRGDTVHDAEAELDGATFSIFYSDLGGGGVHVQHHDAVPERGCFSAQWSLSQEGIGFSLRDGRPTSPVPIKADHTAKYLFDFPTYNEHDREDPRGLWEDKIFVGINRSIGTADRVGRGVRRVRFFLNSAADRTVGPR